MCIRDSIYIASEDFIEEKDIYVLPRNLLRKFVEISDVKAQVGGILYGKSPHGHQNVKEIKTIVMVPQLGNSHAVQLGKIPEHSHYLEGLELLGWIHTQSEELKFMSPSEVTTQARMFGEQNQDVVDLTVSLTPGSISLAAYSLSEEGYSWGVNNKDILDPHPEGFEPTFSQYAQLLLSERIMGNFLVPSSDTWNYAFMGASFNPELDYDLSLIHI